VPLSAIEIYKHLPKTNCGECGSPTCLAFAMRLAGKKAALEECPHVSEEAKAILESASAPPIRLVTIGTGENKLEIGNETVLFRHEATFYHPPGLAVLVESNLSSEQLQEKVNHINSFTFERVGQKLKVELIALQDKDNDPLHYAQTVKLVKEHSPLPLILMSENISSLNEGLKIVSDRRPLIYAATVGNYNEVVNIAKQYNCPLVVKGNDLEEIAGLTPKIVSQGVTDLILDSGSRSLQSALWDLNHIRRLALKRNYRPLGYPTIAFASDGDIYQETAWAAIFITKYAGIIVLKGTEPWEILPLLTLRQNIYTDPQKPIQVEAKLYAVGNPDKRSPLLVTSNFSLTYFTVEGEVEASKVPSHILVVDTEGTSVLTAYAAEKFTAEKIVEALKKNGVENVVAHRKVIIPGYVAVLSGKLEELSGWQILVGPREASGIPNFLKTRWQV